jgi:hypothetical protein
MEDRLTIDGQSFQLLGTQRGGAAVYRGERDYLRLGETQSIERDLALHRLMEKSKYPVPQILAEGELGNRKYFIESAAGARSFRAVFEEDMDSARMVTGIHFDQFLEVVKKLYAAQKKKSDGTWDKDEFADGIRLPMLLAELPSHANVIRQRFNDTADRLARLPKTLTHGDCNPANMYEGGIIDLEDSFYGPLGYDMVSALRSIEWSPEIRSYEFYAQYRFSDAQKAAYLKAFRTIAPHAEDLAFCRAVWLCTGMHEWPRIQQWRYEKFISTYLS